MLDVCSSCCCVAPSVQICCCFVNLCCVACVARGRQPGCITSSWPHPLCCDPGHRRQLEAKQKSSNKTEDLQRLQDAPKRIVEAPRYISLCGRSGMRHSQEPGPHGDCRSKRQQAGRDQPLYCCPPTLLLSVTVCSVFLVPLQGPRLSPLSGSIWTHPDPCLWVSRSCFREHFSFNIFPLSKATALGVSMQPVWLEKQASRQYGKTERLSEQRLLLCVPKSETHIANSLDS